MSKNDFCRCCKKNLRIKGELCNTISIFDTSSKGGCTYEQLRRLGLKLLNTPNKSFRICRSCKNLVTRLERDLPVFRQWTVAEGDQAEDACSPEERARGGASPSEKKIHRYDKICPDPSTPTGNTRRSVTEMSSERPLVGGGAAGNATPSSVVAGGMDQINVVRIDDTHIAEEPSDLGAKVKGEAADYYEVEYSIPEEEEEEEEEEAEEDSVYVIEYSNPEEERDSYQFTMSVDRSLSAQRPVKHPVVKGNATADSAMTSRTQWSSRPRQRVNQKRKRRAEEEEEEEGAVSNKSALELREDASDVGGAGRKQLVCTLCPPPKRLFKTASGLAIHLRETHRVERKKKFSCTSCKRAVHSRTELDAHTRRHAKQGAVYTCSLCPEATDTEPGAETPGFKGTRSGLKRHLEEEHPGAIPRCNICDRRFKTILSYLDDQFRHVGVSPFHCAQCQIYEMTERGLSAHISNHHKKQQQPPRPTLEDVTNTDNSVTDDSDF
ncbi:zinc finger and BTB domain-containing protein 24 [Limanda limanda]|uniref:zinc finger and BTB domain-containing protein 24 n=1 Tax=Limanda limanda TaxID=27771 RepID=UPI0029C65C1E|nr:zinc finger and BTB domain-containing protein 24 [Limanda limanda]